MKKSIIFFFCILLAQSIEAQNRFATSIEAGSINIRDMGYSVGIDMNYQIVGMFSVSANYSYNEIKNKHQLHKYTVLGQLENVNNKVGIAFLAGSSLLDFTEHENVIGFDIGSKLFYAIGPKFNIGTKVLSNFNPATKSIIKISLYLQYEF